MPARNVISSDFVSVCRNRLRVFIFILTTALLVSKSLSSECSRLLSKNLKNQIHVTAESARAGARACVCVHATYFFALREEHSVFGPKKKETVMVDAENYIRRIFINFKWHHCLER